MKSIFKKIAFVLALAMVVTMMPAKAATAAESDGPQMYSTLRLYIGGDATGKYEGERFAKVWNWKDDYVTVSFGSDNTEVATVNEKSGKVTAVGVGSATITATFTAEDGSVVNKTCAVTVKKNAVRAGLSSASTKLVTETGIAAGETVQLTAVRKDADGNVAYKGRDVITDGVRFASSNTDVFTVQKTTGKITGVAEGEATLYVWAIQSEGKDPVTGEYLATTEKKEYTVKVYNAGLLSVKQLSTTKVAITCGNADTAAAIAKDFSKLDASYKLGENDIKTYIKSAAVSSDDAKVVEVELYTAMVKDVVYNFTYDSKTVSLTAVDPDAIAAIRIVTTQAQVSEETEIKVEFLDANGVVINPGANLLTFSAEGSSDYTVYQAGNTGYINFFEAGKTATVTVTYDMGFDNNGNELQDLTASVVIVSKVASAADNFTGYAIGGAGAKASDLTYTTGVLSAVKDESAQLYAKYTVKKYDGSTVTYYNTSSDGNQVENGAFYFKYVSTNDAIVLVDETAGTIYPVASGTAQIIIYRVVGDQEAVVGAVAVKVEDSRVFTSFKATADKTKLSDSATGDKVKITVDAKDQLSQVISGNINYKASLISNVDGVTVTVAGRPIDAEGDNVTVSVDNSTYYFEVTATTTSNTVKNVQLALEATQPGSWITKKIVLNIQVKNPTAAVSYSLDLSQAEINVNLPQATNWWSSTDSKITLNSYDNQGYFVAEVPMTNTSKPAKDAFGFTVMKGNNSITMLDQTFSAVTISGSAITKFVANNPTVGSTGTYTVRVYKGVEINGKENVQQIAVKSITVTDTTSASVATVSSNKVSGTDTASVMADLQAMLANGTLVIKRDGADISSNLEIVGVKCQDRPQVDRVYVEKITVRETLKHDNQYNPWKDKTYEYDIVIGKVFYK